MGSRDERHRPRAGEERQTTGPGRGKPGADQAPPRALIESLVRERVEIVDYDPGWPAAFRAERDHLRALIPPELIGRIEHFGSTAVPALAAKPVIDMLIEVFDLHQARETIAPLLVERGYEYFWRPTHGDDGEPFYAWFIRRDAETGRRTHHLHMVEPGFEEHWRRLLFRDDLILHPDVAERYAALKRRLARRYPRDRAAYTRGKSAFIAGVMRNLRADSARG